MSPIKSIRKAILINKAKTLCGLAALRDNKKLQAKAQGRKEKTDVSAYS